MNKRLEGMNIDFRCELENETEESVDMYLYGAIVEQKPVNIFGEEIEGDYILPKDVRNMVDEAGDRDINLHINSKGGQVFASVPIYNFLKQADNYITVYVDGIAASGASVIAMAGDEVIMPDNTTMMIHEARGAVYGTANDMLETAELLEKITGTVINSYMRRFKGSKEELEELISDETWLNAEEAKTFGLADIVLSDRGEEEEEEQNVKNSVKETLLMKFQNEEPTKKEQAVGNLLAQLK